MDKLTKAGDFIVVGESNGDELRVGLSEYKGKKYLDIRYWYEDENGNRKPGRSGITFKDSEIVDKVLVVVTENMGVIREWI